MWWKNNNKNFDSHQKNIAVIAATCLTDPKSNNRHKFLRDKPNLALWCRCPASNNKFMGICCRSAAAKEAFEALPNPRIALSSLQNSQICLAPNTGWLNLGWSMNWPFTKTSTWVLTVYQYPMGPMGFLSIADRKKIGQFGSQDGTIVRKSEARPPRSEWLRHGALLPDIFPTLNHHG